eukprot:CAMPEP_0180259434 /NCGR_PEP_ID=MMETSP0987-20121128/43000_1 /TAXON_ID=697907 /ORGANISM="non described non described, Strain CCMP2293" /LENGTH=115 /DNA_ID=CAMNT_0022229105 /DNA_START=581 /DNA_END=925 /DNA_ORIENTATION=-
MRSLLLSNLRLAILSGGSPVVEVAAGRAIAVRDEALVNDQLVEQRRHDDAEDDGLDHGGGLPDIEHLVDVIAHVVPPLNFHLAVHVPFPRHVSRRGGGAGRCARGCDEAGRGRGA